MAIQRINLGTAPSGTGGDTNRSAFKKIDGNFADTTNAASRLVGTATGNVMEVGAFGLGGEASYIQDANLMTVTSYARTDASCANLPPLLSDMDKQGTIHTIAWNTEQTTQIYYSIFNRDIFFRRKIWNTWGMWQIFRTDVNTTVDSNGLLKAASPIVRLFADKIELNAEAKLQDIIFEKLGVGDYLIKGSLGFAQEGWYIEMPKDANGNVLVAVVYEQLANNDISVKTYAKKFDEETGDVVANTAKPRDIPSTRWIDLRLQALPQDDTQPLDTDETVATNAK